MSENRPSGTAIKEELTKVIMNEPLLESSPSVAGLREGGYEGISEGSIFYGTGLTTTREVSVGMPFDVLGMVLTAEKLRRTFGMQSIYHHIADTHAKSNHLVEDSEIDRKAKDTRELMLRVAENLELPQLGVVLASEFDTTGDYLDIYRSFDTDKHEYVKREVADIEWYRQAMGVQMKIGWIIQAGETGLGFDERLFDREYKDKIGDNVSFLYLEAGQTFDKQRPKASPYISIAGEARLLLQGGEDVAGKIAEAEITMQDKSLGGARKHLGNIVRVYERLYGYLGQVSFEEKVGTILERAVK